MDIVDTRLRDPDRDRAGGIGGACVRTVVPVQPGVSYLIAVGAGGTAIAGSIEPPYSMSGGTGASYHSVGAGGSGGPGYAILTW